MDGGGGGEGPVREFSEEGAVEGAEVGGGGVGHGCEWVICRFSG